MIPDLYLNQYGLGNFLFDLQKGFDWRITILNILIQTAYKVFIAPGDFTVAPVILLLGRLDDSSFGHDGKIIRQIAPLDLG